MFPSTREHPHSPEDQPATRSRPVHGSVLIAPDSFKGTFTAAQIAQAIAAGVGKRADICPLADGGEGTVDTVLAATGGHTTQLTVHDPLDRPCPGTIGWIDPHTAVIEAASASGLTLVAESERDPERASTRGTGELIAAAARNGAQVIYLGVGGTASTDGGAGAIQAIENGGGLHGAQLRVLCDVTTSFRHAAHIYSPQKGADHDAVARLDERLHLRARLARRDPRNRPYTGAGGGLAGGLWAHYDAELLPGAATILDMIHFDARLNAAAAVITGEGCYDHQTLNGKLVWEITSRARRADRPIHIVAGTTQFTSNEVEALPIASLQLATDADQMRSAGAHVAQGLMAANAEEPARR